MPGFNPESLNVRPPFNIREIRRRAAQFRKLMLIFPYIHPAALHGVIVKNNFNWERILQVLFAGYRVRAMHFWDRVNEDREFEQMLQRQGIRLVCCSGCSEILFGTQGDNNQGLVNTFVQQPYVVEQYPSLDDMDIGGMDNNFSIIIDQQQPGMETTPAPEALETNDVVRIIFGRNVQDGRIEVKVQNSITQPKQVIMVDRTGTLDEVLNVKQTKRNAPRARAVKQGVKKPRITKQKRPEPTGTQNGDNEVEVEPCQTVSKKGKATSKTRVKTSKKKTNNTENNNNN